MTSEPKKILVTGATGTVAPMLVQTLVEQGHNICVLVRNDPSENLLPASVEIVKGDVRDKEALKKAVEDAEWIFHFAAKLHINNPSEKLQAEYEAVNVKAVEDLLKFSRGVCQKFIFASTINVYGTSENGEIFDESSPINPDGIYAETKAEAEKFVLAANGGVVLRLAAIYGSQMKGNFPRLVRAIQKGRFVFVGEGKNRRTLVHAEDVARAAILCAMSEKANGQVYNVTDGEVHTLREIVEAIAEALAKKPPTIKLPLSIVRPAVAVGDKLLKLFGKQKNLRNMLEKINEDLAVSGQKIQNDLGFRPRFDLKNGWKQAVKAMTKKNI